MMKDNYLNKNEVARRIFTEDRLEHVTAIKYRPGSTKETNPEKDCYRFEKNGTYWNYFEDKLDALSKKVPDAMVSTALMCRHLNHALETEWLASTSDIAVECEDGYFYDVLGKVTYMTTENFMKQV
jgi:hypothetical protein